MLKINITMFKIENAEVATFEKSRIWKLFFGDVILKFKYNGYNLFKMDQIFLKCALHEPNFNLRPFSLVSVKKKVIRSVHYLE